MEFRDRTAVATAEAAAAAAPAASVPALAAAVSGKPTFVMSFVLKCAVDGGSEFVPTLSVFFFTNISRPNYSISVKFSAPDQN